jgi:hypothetical protein
MSAAVLLGYLDNLQRHLDKFPALLSAGIPCVAALTNAVLTGPLPLAPAAGGGPAAPAPACAPARAAAARAAHDAALVAAHLALQGALAEVLAWHAALLDAAASLQAALDARAAAAAPPATAAAPLRAAERCRELLCELQGGYAAECAVRAGVASSLLPQRCHALLLPLPGGGGGGGGSGGGGAAPYALARAEESDREALTLCVTAWAVPAHTSAARSQRVTAALRHVLLHEFA